MIQCRRLMSLLLSVALVATAAGCATMKTVKPRSDSTQPRFGPVKAGDTVVLHLRDRRRVEITVARVEGEALVSAEGVRYPEAEIAQLERRSVSGLRTLGFVTGAFLATIAAVAIAVAILWGS